LASQTQVLDIEYATRRDFANDYRANLSNGGVFVATPRRFELRDFVIVRLRLPWCSRMIDLEGEVVHIVSAEMGGLGVQPGVAVQFREPPAGIRGRLGPLCADEDEAPPASPSDDQRRAPRKTVRVAAQLDGASGSIRGRTRNLSHSGVLIDVQEGSGAIGERVCVRLRHPAGGADLVIDGAIVRAATTAGRISAVAVHFEADDARRRDVGRFLDALQEAEHTRRLGGITGPIAELGPQSIVQMLANTARRGTIYLRHAEEEGLICFDAGALHMARIGPVTGMKALMRMMRWEEGTFEFQTTVEESNDGAEPLPLAAALFEVARNIDEGRRIDASAFPLQARLVALHPAEGKFTGALSKVEEALLDVAQAGFTVQRALEVIPEADPEIFRALRSLIDAGMVELH